MPLKVTDYADDSRGNNHILKLWSRLIKQRWPKVTAVSLNAAKPRQLIVQVAPSHKETYSPHEVVIKTVEVHTESVYNFQRHFVPRQRIAVQHYEREEARYYGDSTIFRTDADLFFHGFRNKDPALEATEIISPFFFITQKLKFYLNELGFENHDEPEKPVYHVISTKKVRGDRLTYGKSYEGFRRGTWKEISLYDIHNRKDPPVDMKKVMKTKEGIHKEFYTSVGILVPWRDVRDCMTADPFQPGLANFGA